MTVRKKFSFFMLLSALTIVLQGGCTSLHNTRLPDMLDVYKYRGPCKSTEASVKDRAPFGNTFALANAPGRADNYSFDEDKLLDYCEYGLLLQACGDYKRSEYYLSRAREIVEHFNNKAIFSVGEAGKDAASILINDNTMSYKGETFERIFIDTYQALNYYMLGEKKDARREIDRAYKLQNDEKMRLEDDVYKHSLADEQRTRAGGAVDWRAFNSELKRVHRSSDMIADKVPNSYENGFTYYLSSVIDEEMFDRSGGYRGLDNAYIDLKDAHALLPRNKLILQHLIRLAEKKGRVEDIKDYVKKLQHLGGMPLLSSEYKDKGRIVIFISNGLAPQKDQIKLPVPLKNTLLFVAYPVLKRAEKDFYGFYLKDRAGKLISESVKIADIEALANKNYKEKRPAVIARIIARVVAKGIASYEISERAGGIGSLMTSIFNFVTEQADVRSWRTLPAEISVMDFFYKPGDYTFTFEGLSMRGAFRQRVDIPVEVKEGVTTIVNVYTPGKGIIVSK